MKVLKICLTTFFLLCSVAFAFAAEESISRGAEYDLVEKVVQSRTEYKLALEGLVEFYNKLGDAGKLGMAREELEAFDDVPQNQYLLVVRKVKPGTATENIVDANRLYKDGLSYKKYPDIFRKKKKLREAVKRFTTLLEKYPASDKADDACYMLGDIYAGFYFRDYSRAVKYYEECFRIDSRTRHPARLKAAEIYHRKLKLLDKAMELYEETEEDSPFIRNRQIASKRIVELKAQNIPSMR